MKINQIILAPVLTEKVANLTKNRVYVFKVNKAANKFQVKEALEKIYQIKVGKIRMQIRKGKNKRFGKRRSSKQLPDEKIAYISVIEGKIDLFPQS